MSVTLAAVDRRRALTELALLTAMGLIVGVLGPFATAQMPALPRHLYWLICIVGGGVIGIGLDALLARWIARPWRRLPVTIALMTPAVTLFVIWVSAAMFGQHRRLIDVWLLLWQVSVVSLAVMTARALVWREPKRVVEVRTVVAPPLPEAEATFRRRLSAKRRTARLIAIEAYDHYLRVHTDAGEELVTARFKDALDELYGAHGLRIHRSWWVSVGAIEAVSWRRGAGEAQLVGGLKAPISRSHAPSLREAGWF